MVLFICWSVGVVYRSVAVVYGSVSVWCDICDTDVVFVSAGISVWLCWRGVW